MLKWFIYLCYLIPLYVASELPAERSDAIDNEIQVLEERLHQIRIEELRKEVRGQDEMMDEWDAYAKDLQSIRKLEKEEEKLKIKIKELKNRKVELEKSKL